MLWPVVYSARAARLGRVSLIILGVILVAHFAAIARGWYLRESPIDNVYHVLGGAFLASLCFYIFASRPHLFDLERHFPMTLLVTVSIVVLLGVSWELFEFSLDSLSAVRGSLFRTQMSVRDTLGDLAADALGAALFVCIFGRKRRRSG